MSEEIEDNGLEHPAARFRAKVYSQCHSKSFFDGLAQNIADKIEIICRTVIMKYLREMGNQTVQAAQFAIELATPSGRRYRVVDEDKTIIAEWTASSDNDPPMSLTELLKRSIEYRIKFSEYAVTIGVWSEENWRWPTIAFYGQGFFDSRDTKAKGLEYEDQVGTIVTGPGGIDTSVSDYARYLEHGTEKMAPRSFLGPSFEENVEELHDEWREWMHEEFQKEFSKKIPIHFRIKTKKY